MSQAVTRPDGHAAGTATASTRTATRTATRTSATPPTPPLLSTSSSASTTSTLSSGSSDSSSSLQTPSTLAHALPVVNGHKDESDDVLGLQLQTNPTSSSYPSPSTPRFALPPRTSSIPSPTSPRPLTTNTMPFQYPDVSPSASSSTSTSSRRRASLGSCSTPRLALARMSLAPQTRVSSSAATSPVSPTSPLPASSNRPRQRPPIAFTQTPRPTPIPPSLLARRRKEPQSVEEREPVVVSPKWSRSPESVGVRFGPAGPSRGDG